MKKAWLNLVLAFLGGSILGAAVMLLTTPKTGREMRRSLRVVPDALKSASSSVQKAVFRK